MPNDEGRFRHLSLGDLERLEPLELVELTRPASLLDVLRLRLEIIETLDRHAEAVRKAFDQR